ncbi:MAG: type IV secretion system DNA-binding domain-containing protein [Patescibacteria group bacterium]
MINNKEVITLFAKTNFRNKEVAFGIKTDDRRRHMYLMGKTGMGKTTMMENMVIQDIKNGHGVCFIDPHGDSVARILNSVPSSRINDVIYFNPADLEHPIAFNILESVDPRYKHLVASGLMGVFTKIWANVWSARMEYILNNTILALLESPGNTLLGITRMYVDKQYRKKIIDNVKDPVVRTFWTDEYANYNEKYRTEAIAPIQNKVGQFLSSSIVRNIVGQPKSTIDLRELMDAQKILIVDISKGKVGEDNAALLGAMIITKIQLAALSRANVTESERKDFYLYVDEFQNFATDSFATILSEARKYRLNLIVGHQYIAQLEQDKNTKVRDAIFGNVGTMVMFRIGAADAEYLETEFEPIFTPNDLVNLPRYNIILKLMINGVASDPFSAVTLSPEAKDLTDNREKIINISRERYTNPANMVEEKIARWMGSDYHREAAILIGQHTEEELENDENTTAFEKIIEEKIESPVNLEPVKAIKPVDIPLPKPVIREQKDGRPRQEKRRNDQQHRNNSQRKFGQKPRYSEQKKENPVWRTVQNLQVAKAKEELERLDKHLNGLDKSLSQQIQKAKPDNTEQAKIVLKPGETHAMNFFE